MLFLFANAPELDPPKHGDAGVCYYGQGIYYDDIAVKSSEAIYLAGAAVVFGSLNVWGAEHGKIAGRGTVVCDGLQDPNSH